MMGPCYAVGQITSALYINHQIPSFALNSNLAAASPTMAETLFLRGTLRGHSDMVTAFAVPITGQARIVSSSRDKSLLVWDLDPLALSANGLVGEGESYSPALGKPFRRLTGHTDFVQDVALSSHSMVVLSCSADSRMRLWNLSTGKTRMLFAGHHEDVLSVVLSSDDCIIVSGSRDCSIKLWNNIGHCKNTIHEAHDDCVSCVRMTPGPIRQESVVVSGSWDCTVKVWSLVTFKLVYNLTGHNGHVNAVAISPDGSLCASGGEDGVTLLWNLAEGKRLFSFDAGAVIHSLCFSPSRYWLCAATENGVKIWDLVSKSIVQDDQPLSKEVLHCTSLNWNVDGNTLFTGYSDGTIRIWGVTGGNYNNQ